MNPLLTGKMLYGAKQGTTQKKGGGVDGRSDVRDREKVSQRERHSQLEVAALCDGYSSYEGASDFNHVFVIFLINYQTRN